MKIESAQINLALAWLCAASAHAQGQPGDIFNYAASGRASAMGGAYTALASDASSIYYNPAGLGLVRALMPRRKASLKIEQQGDLVLATVTLVPPGVTRLAPS